MKTFLFNILVFCSLIAQSQIEALLDIKKFHSTESDYIETYLYVFGNTLYESSDTNNTEKGIEVLQYIENQNKQIISHKKYIIKEVSDYVEKEGIIDLQRFPISDGEYTLFIEIIDINNPSNIEKHQELSLIHI